MEVIATLFLTAGLGFLALRYSIWLALLQVGASMGAYGVLSRYDLDGGAWAAGVYLFSFVLITVACEAVHAVHTAALNKAKAETDSLRRAVVNRGGNIWLGEDGLPLVKWPEEAAR